MIKYFSNMEGQKDKIYCKGPHQMAGSDILEHKKQSRSLERKNIEKDKDRNRRSKGEYDALAEKVAKEKVKPFFADVVDAEQEVFDKTIN